MGITRRKLILAGLGLAAGGCSSTVGKMSRRPGPGWPQAIGAPSRSNQVISKVNIPKPSVKTPDTHVSTSSEAQLLKELGALPRSMWTTRNTIVSRTNPMDGVNRITAHHEGYTQVYFTSKKDTEKRIHEDQHDHMNVRGWADIGYHFIVDRAGRLWEARPVRYQGAHVKYHNAHNIGVMCLGNFMKQEPTTAQVQRLGQTLKQLKEIYSVPVNRIYTHRELMPNLCPGNNMQPHINSMRTDGYLGNMKVLPKIAHS